MNLLPVSFYLLLKSHLNEKTFRLQVILFQLFFKNILLLFFFDSLKNKIELLIFTNKKEHKTHEVIMYL